MLWFGIRIARHVTVNGVERRCRIAHRARDDEIGCDAVERIGKKRALAETSARWLQSDKSAGTGRDTDRTSAVIGMRQRNNSGGDRCRRSARRTAGRVGEVPRILRGAVKLGLGRCDEPEFGNVRHAKQVQSRGFEFLHEIAVAWPRKGRNESRRLARGHALRERADVLQQERHAAERTFGKFALRRIARAFIVLEDDGVELWVERFGALDCLVDQLSGFDFFLGDESGQSQPVIRAIRIKSHYTTQYLNIGKP